MCLTGFFQFAQQGEKLWEKWHWERGKGDRNWKKGTEIWEQARQEKDGDCDIERQKGTKSERIRKRKRE